MDEQDKPVVLVTGGAGYIGSHAVLSLVEHGYHIIVVDNYSNGSEESLNRVMRLTGKSFPVHKADMLDSEQLDSIFAKHPEISSVIHFAAVKSVCESVRDPLKYYSINVVGTLNLLKVMNKHNVKQIIFSSSATVYGDPRYLPMDEKHPVGDCTSPYAKSKMLVEGILADLCDYDKEWKVTILRYFNPVGAHKSGLIGEDPQGETNNLTPFISQVAVGKMAELLVYGNDYNTHDGTGVRDYIHIVDLVDGHVAALKKLNRSNGLNVYNLGTGKGMSVLDVVKAFEKATGKMIKYKIMPRRPGDVAAMCADPTKAEHELQWKAVHGIDEMCKDLWNWQVKNPYGFRNGTTTH